MCSISHLPLGLDLSTIQGYKDTGRLRDGPPDDGDTGRVYAWVTGHRPVSSAKHVTHETGEYYTVGLLMVRYADEVMKRGAIASGELSPIWVIAEIHKTMDFWLQIKESCCRRLGYTDTCAERYLSPMVKEARSLMEVTETLHPGNANSPSLKTYRIHSCTCLCTSMPSTALPF